MGIRDPRSPIQKYLDIYWDKYMIDEITKKEKSKREIDKAVHQLINQMLINAEKDPHAFYKTY